MAHKITILGTKAEVNFEQTSSFRKQISVILLTIEFKLKRNKDKIKKKIIKNLAIS